MLGGLPAGFISVPAGLGFLSGVFLLICVRDRNFWQLMPYEKVGLLLLIWLAISGLWSQAGLKETLVGLEDYHIFLMLPVASWVLSLTERGPYWVGAGALAGAILSLAISYMLGLGVIDIPGYTLSLGNRIYHAQIMACLLIVGVSLTLISTDSRRAIGIGLFVAAFCNLLFIETGRTGYLIAIGVTVGVIGVYLPWKRTVAIGACLVLAVGFGYQFNDKFKNRVDQTLENGQRALFEKHYKSSAGLRIEWWRGAVKLGMEQPIFGRGIGDVKADLTALYKQDQMREWTRNVHNEYLHLLLAGGFVAVFLIIGFVSTLIISGRRVLRQLPLVGLCLVGAGLMTGIAGLFNSTIMNFSTKYVLIIMLIITGGLIRRQYQPVTRVRKI